MKTLRHLLRGESGATAVEFALVSGVLMSLLIGIVFVGIMLFTNVALHWAVERTIRLAALNSAETETAMKSEVNEYLSSMGIPTATVTYSVTDGMPAIGHINATLIQTYAIPMLPSITINYSADAKIPLGS